MGSVREYAESVATADVRATLEWLDGAGYTLSQSSGSPGETFGNLALVFSGGCVVQIVRDRGQWMADLKPASGPTFYNLDLLVPAALGIDYPEPSPGDRLPDQLPDGVSWREVFPIVLDWLQGPGAAEAVARMGDQRYVLMWPTSHQARDIRRRWKREGGGPAGPPKT
jgi:hypothetical protein